MKLPQDPPILSSERLAKALPFLGDIKAEQSGKYLHWDQLRRRKPPNGLTHEVWWTGVLLSRRVLHKRLPLSEANGSKFSLAMTDGMQSLAHQIDRDASGSIRAPEAITNKATQQRYLVRSLIEEALTSSQLEGAVATAKEAKQLIRAGRPPRNNSERMVLNNFRAMEFIRDRRTHPLTPDFVQELHAVITEGTLEDADDAGRIRAETDDIKVVDHADDTILHTPPPAAELDERIDSMCAFANGGGEGFIHPVVRAVLLHFWLGYDHPFCDGNGRTARALFYWSMLNQGYWMTEYISISRVLKQAPIKYVRSYLYSETWPYDATHFVLYQFETIRRSIEELHAYLETKIQEVRDVEQLLQSNRDLNHRQLALLGGALRNPGSVFTMATHKKSHRVSHETARQDLYKLRDMGLLTEHKRGRGLEFAPVTDLGGVLSSLRGLRGTARS